MFIMPIERNCGPRLQHSAPTATTAAVAAISGTAFTERSA